MFRRVKQVGLVVRKISLADSRTILHVTNVMGQRTYVCTKAVKHTIAKPCQLFMPLALKSDAAHKLSPFSLFNSVWCRASSTGENQRGTEGGLSTEDESQHHLSRSRQPTHSEKKIFVWTGKYKTVEDVPEFVSEAALTNAKSRFRIYINISMGVATLIAAITMIIIGKSRAKKGESISKLNMERHPEIYPK